MSWSKECIDEGAHRHDKEVMDAVIDESRREDARVEMQRLFAPSLHPLRPQSIEAFRNRNAFTMTLTDDSDIAAAAMMGESNNPNAG